jgi:bifunctional DNA-binding transcriptional regulator/antitoxin component of YhaV-PrlF toxin-antitoxin module
MLLLDELKVDSVMEEFVALVLAGGKVTVPKQLRERFDVSEACYVRLALLEVLKKGKGGVWVKRRVEP